MNKKILALIIALLTVATAIAGCSNGNKGEGNNSTATDDDTLTIAVADELNVIDPIHGYSTEPDAILMQVVEGLYYFASDNSIQPLIAESYTQPDELTYVYKIREDVTFSDGNKLTADDVVFSLERHTDESNPSELAWMFDSVDTITKTGDYEVTVKLSKPDPMWQDSLATSAGLVIEKSYFEQHKDNFGTVDGGIIGSGPYVISQWSPGQQIELTANDNYWNKDTTLDFKKLVFKAINDDSVTKLSLESGQVDVALRLTVESAKEFEGNNNIDIQPVDMFACNFLSFNTSKEPFNDINVRKAIAYAIDKNALTESIYGENYAQTAVSTFFSSSIVDSNDNDWSSYFNNLEKYDYNIEKAKEYLEKSSVPNGFEAKLIYKLSDSTAEATVLAIQQDLAKINIKITLEGVTGAEISTQRYGGSETRTYDLMYTKWGTDYPDPVGVILPMFLSSNNIAGGSNWTEYKSEKFDNFMDEQAKTSDKKQRDEVLRNALDVLSDDIPSVPLNYPYILLAKNSRVDYQFSNMLLYNIHFKDFKKAK